MLCIFNLIPVPPLDGSKILEAVLPSSLAYTYHTWRGKMEQNPFIGMAIVLAFIVFLGGTFGNVIYSVAQVLAGM
jgi:Zn-dependent protease